MGLEGVTDVFIKDIRRHCSTPSKLVSSFHHSNRALLAKMCRARRSTPLVSLKKKQVYPQDLFESEQRAHHDMVASAQWRVHLSMQGPDAHDARDVPLRGRGGTARVKRFVEQIDKSVEDALRVHGQASLQELSRSINGDAKTEVWPRFFRISVVLRTARSSSSRSIPS